MLGQNQDLSDLIQVVLLYLLQSVLVSSAGRLQLLDLDLTKAPPFIHFLYDGVEVLQPPPRRRQQRLQV